MRPGTRRRLGATLRILFTVAGLVFLAVVFAETWSRSRHHVLPSGWAVGGAFPLALAGLAFGGQSWASLLSGQAPRAALARGFFTSQLGKYVPGAIWQAVGQVGLAQRAGVTGPAAVAAFPVHAIIQAAAGGTIGAGLLVFGWRVGLGVRLLSLGGLLLVLLLRRAWMVSAVNALARVMKRSWPQDLVPAQDRILRSYGWAVASLGGGAAAFTVLAASVDAPRSIAASIPAFALAWTAGFLALPFPSGVGIREAVLLGVLAEPGRAAPMIAASLAHRLVTMVVELSLVFWAALRRTRRVPAGSESAGAGSA